MSFLTIEIVAIVGALTVVVAWALFRVVGKAVEQPVTITVKPITNMDQSWSDAPTYFIQTTFNLQQLGFSQFLDFTVPEMEYPGVYRGLISNDHLHMVVLHEIYPTSEDQVGSQGHRINYMEFQSVLGTGVKINTNNATVPLPLSAPPEMVIVQKKGVDDARDLFQEHLEMVNKLVGKNGTYLRTQSESEFPYEFEKDWERAVGYNIEKGILTRTDHGNACHGTARLVWRYFRVMITG